MPVHDEKRKDKVIGLGSEVTIPSSDWSDRIFTVESISLDKTMLVVGGGKEGEFVVTGAFVMRESCRLV
jgi:hypothetical protein